MFAADRDVFRALESMSALDDEAVGGAMRRGEAIRSRGMARLAGRLDEQGVLLPGVTAERAADVLWLLTSFDAFDQLYTGARPVARRGRRGPHRDGGAQPLPPA